MKIAIGCDHGGIVLKPAVLKRLEERGIKVEDFGTFSEESVDYPDYALKVAEAVKDGKADCGILLCGTGIGIGIAANKVPGIRCALVSDLFSAKACKEHNNANIISMGGRVTDSEKAVAMLDAWLDAEYQGGRHQNRLDKITAIEQKYSK